MNDADKLIEAAAMAIINKEYPMRLALGPISIDEAKEFARAALSAIEAEGWVLVPVEPTIKMCDAAMELSENQSRTGWRYVPKAPGDAWRRP